MRYLAIDPGEKRVGLAVGDDETGIASPFAVIESSDAAERVRRMELAIADSQPSALVVGLPLNMDGTEGPSAERARVFARDLADRFNLPVHLVDERLTSYSADTRMTPMNLTHKKKKARRDAIAAAEILKGFLETLPRPDGDQA